MKKRIFVNMCCLTGLTILLTSILILSIYYNMIDKQVQNETQGEAYYVASACNRLVDKVSYLEEITEEVDIRLTLIEEDGRVLYDNKSAADEMENHKNRPEVSQAFESGSGEATRLSDTLRDQTYYYAVRLDNGMVIRLAGSVDSIFTTLFRVFPSICIVALVIMVFALLLANKMTKAIVSPINALDLKNPKIETVYDELQPLLRRIRKQNDQIQKQMSQMTEQKEKIVAITENMSEGLILIDHQTNIMSLNNSCKNLLMAPDAEYEGKNIIMLNRSPQLLETVSQSLKGKTHSEVIELNHKYLQIYGNPVLEDGIIQGAVILILDVTEKQRAEKIRKEFSANVSHELKTPLTSISGYAELIQSGIVNQNDIPEFAGKIFKEAGRLITLVNDIIKISQLDEKNIGVTKEYVNLYAAAAIVVERLTPVAQKRNITMTLNGQRVVLYAVAQMMDELIYNLCENALKYNKENGQVTIDLYEKENEIVFKVTDTGIGISPKHQDRVFERFYRVDKSHSKQTGGTGLGLAIVKHVVEYHEGYLKINSQLDQGTQISAHFPTQSS